MPANNKDKIDNLILETADRLRLVRADSADESDQLRRGRLCRELEKALAAVAPAQREDFLKRLLGAVQLGAEGQEAQGASNVDERGLGDAVSVVQRLLEIIPALTDEQNVVIDRTLQEAGIRPGTGHEDSIDLSTDLKAKLDIDGQFSASGRDLAELAIVLVEFILKLEPLVWNTWRALSPRSGIRPRGSLAKEIGQFLAADGAVPSDALGEDLKVLQKLIAAMTTAVSRAGGQFARRHLATFSPSEIAALVRTEPGGVFVSHEVKCWRKYVELAERLDEDAIDMQIKKAIVDYVESLAK